MERASFIINDESINRDGFRVLTSGIQLENFMKNPVGLFMHQRAQAAGIKNSILPICRWENLYKSEGKLIGDAVFDMEDPFAKLIANKVHNNFIKAVSMGINVLGIREEFPSQPSEVFPIVTDSDLVEISICDIGSNTNSVKLYYASKPASISEVSLNFGLELQTEWERLWKTGDLERLKLKEPCKYNLLLSEFIQTKNKCKSSTIQPESELSFDTLEKGYEEFKKLHRNGDLERLKSNSPGKFDHLNYCFKLFYNNYVKR